MDKPVYRIVAQFYSGKIRQNGALLLRRLAQFYSGVDTILGTVQQMTPRNRVR
jgi:hypothetical protein